MNKAMYICAAAAMALTSCSNDETVEQAKNNAISFRSVVELNSRAAGLMTTDSLQKKGELYVTTFKEDGSILYDETKYTYSGSQWTSNPYQYWLNGKKLSFLLTYPQLEKWQAGATLTKDSKTVNVTAEDVHTDFLVGYAEKQSEPASGTALQVDMKHAFSQIEVLAKNTNPNYVYKVKGVRFGHVLKTVKMNLETLDFEKTGNGDWAYLDIKFDTPFELDDTPRSLMGNDTIVILPPQKGQNYIWDGKSSAGSDTSGTFISVLINLTAKAGAVIYPQKTDTDYPYAWACVPVDFNWESGKKYIYTLDFSRGAGQMGPDRFWGYKGTYTYLGGTGYYILGEPMTFSVTVKDWDASTSFNAGLTN